MPVIRSLCDEYRIVSYFPVRDMIMFIFVISSVISFISFYILSVTPQISPSACFQIILPSFGSQTSLESVVGWLLHCISYMIYRFVNKLLFTETKLKITPGSSLLLISVQ